MRIFETVGGTQCLISQLDFNFLIKDYQVDLYLRQHWLDPRLHHPSLVDPLDLNDPNLVKAIWKPEVYFPNAKDAEFQVSILSTF